MRTDQEWLQPKIEKQRQNKKESEDEKDHCENEEEILLSIDESIDYLEIKR